MWIARIFDAISGKSTAFQAIYHYGVPPKRGGFFVGGGLPVPKAEGETPPLQLLSKSSFYCLNRMLYCNQHTKNDKEDTMNFTEIAENRQSCRSYDPDRMVEKEKLDRILASARLSPSACNGQPYQITVCKGETAKKVAKATQGMGMNKFATNAPVLIVLSEMPYVASAALGAKVKKNDYRSIDIGILAAYITAEAAAQGLGTCILGWLEDQAIREICGLEGTVRLVITLGYATAEDKLRTKKRKDITELVKIIEA